MPAYRENEMNNSPSTAVGGLSSYTIPESMFLDDEPTYSIPQEMLLDDMQWGDLTPDVMKQNAPKKDFSLLGKIYNGLATTNISEAKYNDWNEFMLSSQAKREEEAGNRALTAGDRDAAMQHFTTMRDLYKKADEYRFKTWRDQDEAAGWWYGDMKPYEGIAAGLVNDLGDAAENIPFSLGSGITGTLAGLAGTGIGFLAAGPAGAAVGNAIGSAIGGAYSGYNEGMVHEGSDVFHRLMEKGSTAEEANRTATNHGLQEWAGLAASNTLQNMLMSKLPFGKGIGGTALAIGADALWQGGEEYAQNLHKAYSTDDPFNHDEAAREAYLAMLSTLASGGLTGGTRAVWNSAPVQNAVNRAQTAAVNAVRPYGDSVDVNNGLGGALSEIVQGNATPVVGTYGNADMVRTDAENGTLALDYLDDMNARADMNDAEGVVRRSVPTNSGLDLIMNTQGTQDIINGAHAEANAMNSAVNEFGSILGDYSATPQSAPTLPAQDAQRSMEAEMGTFGRGFVPEQPVQQTETPNTGVSGALEQIGQPAETAAPAQQEAAQTEQPKDDIRKRNEAQYSEWGEKDAVIRELNDKIAELETAGQKVPYELTRQRSGRLNELKRGIAHPQRTTAENAQQTAQAEQTEAAQPTETEQPTMPAPEPQSRRDAERDMRSREEDLDRRLELAENGRRMSEDLVRMDGLNIASLDEYMNGTKDGAKRNGRKYSREQSKAIRDKWKQILRGGNRGLPLDKFATMLHDAGMIADNYPQSAIDFLENGHFVTKKELNELYRERKALDAERAKSRERLDRKRGQMSESLKDNYRHEPKRGMPDDLTANRNATDAEAEANFDDAMNFFSDMAKQDKQTEEKGEQTQTQEATPTEQEVNETVQEEGKAETRESLIERQRQLKEAKQNAKTDAERAEIEAEQKRIGERLSEIDRERGQQERAKRAEEAGTSERWKLSDGFTVEGVKTESAGRTLAGAREEQFVLRDGNNVWGEVTEDLAAGREDVPVGPIMVKVGTRTHGLKHVMQKHLGKIRELGFGSAEEYITHVIDNATEIIPRGEDKFGRPTEFLVAFDEAAEKQPSILLVWENNDGYYTLKTAFADNKAYFERQKSPSSESISQTPIPASAPLASETPLSTPEGDNRLRYGDGDSASSIPQTMDESKSTDTTARSADTDTRLNKKRKGYMSLGGEKLAADDWSGRDDGTPDSNRSYRFTREPNAVMSDYGHAMFADDVDANSAGYGDYAWSVSNEDLTSWEDTKNMIVSAIEGEINENGELDGEMKRVFDQITDDYEYRYEEKPSTREVAEAIAEEFNPQDIVESAGAWDNGDMMEWFYNNVAKPNKIKGVKTQDGAISFEESIISPARGMTEFYHGADVEDVQTYGRSKRRKGGLNLDAFRRSAEKAEEDGTVKSVAARQESARAQAADDADTEARMQEAFKGVKDEAGWKKTAEGIKKAIGNFHSEFPELSRDKTLYRAMESLRRRNSKSNSAIAFATESLEKSIGMLKTPEQYQLFTRKRVFDDLAEQLKTNPDARLPFGLTPETLASEREKITKLTEGDRTVSKAIETEEAEIKRINDELIAVADKAGLKGMRAKLGRNHYFHHEVIAYAQAELAGDYMKARRGSSKDINLNYAQAMGTVRALMLRDIEMLRSLAEIKADYDRSADFKKGDAVPKGYVEFKPFSGKLIFSLGTVADHISAEAAEQIERIYGNVGEEIVQVVSGKEDTWIIPQGIADELNRIGKANTPTEIKRVAKMITNEWKNWTLNNPIHAPAYNLRNITGDSAAAFAGNIRTFLYAPRAIGELKDVYFGGKKASGELAEFQKRGGAALGNNASMLYDPAGSRAFKNLDTRTKGERAAEIAKHPLRSFMDAAKFISDFREQILRYATYLSYLDQMKKSEDGKTPDNWGASKREEVLAVDDARDRAFKMSNELIGAYDQVSVSGQEIRDSMMPFYAWLEVNSKRFGRLLANNPANVAGKFGAAYAMMYLFNNFFHKDEEEELPEDVRWRPHINLGKWGGKVRYFDRIGMMTDLLEWVNLDDYGAGVKQVLNGQLSVEDFLKDMALAVPKKMVDAMGPGLKTAVELRTNTDTYTGGRINQIDDHIMNTFGLRKVYRAMMGKRGEDLTLTDGFFNMFSSSAEGNRVAYSHIKQKVREYQERVLKRSTDASSTNPKSEAWRDMISAAEYGQKKKYNEARKRYIRAGGDLKSIKEAKKRLDPLSGLSKEDRVKFLRWLTPEERKLVTGSGRAMKHYYKVTARIN